MRAIKTYKHGSCAASQVAAHPLLKRYWPFRLCDVVLPLLRCPAGASSGILEVKGYFCRQLPLRGRPVMQRGRAWG